MLKIVEPKHGGATHQLKVLTKVAGSAVRPSLSTVFIFLKNLGFQNQCTAGDLSVSLIINVITSAIVSFGINMGVLL